MHQRNKNEGILSRNLRFTCKKQAANTKSYTYLVKYNFIMANL